MAATFVLGLLLCGTVFSQDFNTVKPDTYVMQLADCKSPRGLTGYCVSLERCGYGTNGIDSRLYRPKNYRSRCAYPEVCCPLDSVLTPEDFERPDIQRFD